MSNWPEPSGAELQEWADQMTDPLDDNGLSALAAAIHRWNEEHHEEGCVHFDKGYGPYAQCEDAGLDVPRGLAESTIATLNGIIDLNNADIHDRDEALVMVRASVVKQREEIATLRAALEGAVAELDDGTSERPMSRRWDTLRAALATAAERAALATVKETP